MLQTYGNLGTSRGATMITSDNYENQNFGWFRIMDKFGVGAEAEVFHCLHVPTNRVYVLRLDVEDDAIWERSQPMLPPRNYTIERRNVRGSAQAAQLFSQMEKDKDAPRSEEGWSFRVTELYGVRDNKYLLPVSNIYRRRGAFSFDQVLDLNRAFTKLSFWEDIGLLAQAETRLLNSNSISIETWKERWGILLHESKLRTWIEAPLADLPQQLGTAVKECLNREIIIGPCLEESAIASIIVARSLNIMTQSELEASLRCPFFRMNITLRDLHYVVSLLELYSEVPWILHGTTEVLDASAGLILTAIAHGLSVQPDQDPDSSEQFEPCEPPSEDILARYDLILQELAASHQQFLSLKRSRKR